MNQAEIFFFVIHLRKILPAGAGFLHGLLQACIEVSCVWVFIAANLKTIERFGDGGSAVGAESSDFASGAPGKLAIRFVSERCSVSFLADFLGGDAVSFDAKDHGDLIALFGARDEGARERFLLGANRMR